VANYNEAVAFGATPTSLSAHRPATQALPQIAPFSQAVKIPEFFKKSSLSRAKKHQNFQVTSCHQNDTTNVDFAYVESE
jgi:hypothetical protein